MYTTEGQEFYTVKEVAEKLKVKPQQIYKILKDKEIVPTMVGKAIRISQKEFEKYVNQ